MSDLFQRLFSLEGKRALVTGASGGIGRVLAVALAEAGAQVAIHGTNSAKLEGTRTAVQHTGRSAFPLPADLTEQDSPQRLIGDACDRLGRLDILINCAGANRRKPISEVTAEDFDHIITINLRSLFFLCQAAYVVMHGQGGGKIINVGSVTTTDGLGGVSVYGASKAAVGQLTKTMALEWAKDNIQVNCLAPGFIMTPLTEKGLWGDPHRKQWLTERIPMQRPGKPEELVAVMLMLAGNGSSYLTGQIINVDGGYLAGGSWLEDNL